MTTEKFVEFSVCLICQKATSENLAEKLSPHEKVLKRLEEWAIYGYLRYFDLWWKLKSVSVSKLLREKYHGAETAIRKLCTLDFSKERRTSILSLHLLTMVWYSC